MNPRAQAINSCKYLDLNELGEPAENALRIVISEAVAGRAVTSQDIAYQPSDIQALLVNTGATAIEHQPGCRTFELIWPSYVGYSVRNEGFALPEPESGDGTLFVTYRRSRYLDFISTSTFANSDYPGELRHWAIYCLDHCVDVVSTCEPEVAVCASK